MISLSLEHKDVLNKLINIYERRKLNSSSFVQRVMLKVNEKHFKNYYNNKNLYDIAIEELLNEGLINVDYRQFTRYYDQIILNINRINDIYILLKRININDSILILENTLLEYYNCSIIANISEEYYESVRAGRSIRSFLDKNFIDTLKAIYYIENNKEDLSERVFSNRVFKDSKRLEQLKTNIIKYYNNDKDIFKKKNIFKNPSYLTVKGEGLIQIGKQQIQLEILGSSIGLELSDIDAIKFSQIKSVTTIENLTTFHEFSGAGLIIYLGGFSTSSQNKILLELKKQTTNFIHFGDIDFGGYTILDNLINILGINIKTIHMDLETIKSKIKFAQSITNDEYLTKLKSLLDKPNLSKYYDAIEYLIKERIWLEQESI